MSEPIRGDEELLEVPSELLWRSVLPEWVDDGKIRSSAFKPNSGDQKKMSVAREEKVSAEDHYDEYRLSNRSGGVWAISVEEVNTVGSRAIDDSASKERPTPCPKGHAYVDFRDFGSSRTDKVGARLRTYAQTRGRQAP